MGQATTDPSTIGLSLPRLEDRELLTGSGRFVDDIQVPGMLHAAFLRSPHAHAKVISIKHLADAVMQKIDASNSSFWAAKSASTVTGSSLRLMERQRLAMWLQHAYEELAKADA